MAGAKDGLFRALVRATGRAPDAAGPRWQGRDRSTIGLLATSRKTGDMPFASVKDSASFSGRLLLVVKPQRPLGPAEVRAIVQRVQQGMGLLLVGDGGEDNTNLNPLAIWFGVQFNNDIVSAFDKMGATTQTPYTYAWKHPITEPVHYYEVDKSCSLRLRDWNRQVLLFSNEVSFSDADASGTWDTGEYLGSCAVMAKAEYGQGRAVFVGDAIMFERDTRADRLLLDQTLRWLNHEI